MSYESRNNCITASKIVVYYSKMACQHLNKLREVIVFTHLEKYYEN